jgi:two-component system, NarL family, response regulator YdfI
MIAIAVFSVDSTLRRSLKQLPRKDPAIAIVGIVDSAAALLELFEKHQIEVVLANEAPGKRQLAELQVRYKQTAWVVFSDFAGEQKGLDAIGAGASAVLPRSSDLAEIAAAIRAVTNGLVVFHRKLLPTLLNPETLSIERTNKDPNGHLRLTAREIEVLTAMADGTSNKEIARSLGISFHTVKFHVAAVLEKLGADTRTEAVIKSAQLGIVML